MGFLNAIGFLTIFKVPYRVLQKKISPANTLLNFNIVGLLIGLVLAASYFIFGLFLPSVLVIILIVGLEIILSGGIHIDGLSDTSDGLFSGQKELKKILVIMKKGDTGVFGVLSIVFDIILRVALLFFIQREIGDVLLFLPVLLFMPFLGRFSMVYLLTFFRPTARSKSLTYFFRQNGSKKVFYISLPIVILVVFGIKSTLFLLYGSPGQSLFGQGLSSVFVTSVILLLITVGVVLAVSYMSTVFFTSKLDGITGDIIGAVNELVELGYLFFIFIFVRYIGMY